MNEMSIEQIRKIKEAQEKDVRRKVREGRWNEIQEEAECNLGIWQELWAQGRFLPQGRPDPRKHLKGREK